MARQVKVGGKKIEFTGAILDDEIGEFMEYWQLIKYHKCKQIWSHSYGNKLGKLAKEMPGQVDSINTMLFVHKHEVLVDR